MNQLKEAARLALDALSNASWHLPEGKDIDQQCEKAINALRAALALPDAEPVAWLVFAGIGDMRPVYPAHKTQALAEQAASTIKSVTEVRPLYLAPQPAIAPEPVWLTDDERDEVITPWLITGNGNMHRLVSALEDAIHAKQGGKPWPAQTPHKHLSPPIAGFLTPKQGAIHERTNRRAPPRR